jgi:O-methyltransferase
MGAVRNAVKRMLARRGFEQVPRQDLEPEFLELYDRCRPYTMTSIERMYALYTSVRHVIEREVAGDVVECGVFAGGSAMLAALTLQRLGDDTRRVWLYDTFTGMSEPTAQDGAEARAEWERNQRGAVNLWCYTSRADVEKNMASTGFDPDRLVFVPGKVEDTIPASAPERIGLLRLDTDWYESTYHELVHLYPRLQSGGVLIVDDYGHFEGARAAVDRYFGESGEHPLLTRVDYTARVAVKA